MSYRIQLAIGEESMEEIKELAESAEETWLTFLAAPGSRFGECECGNCKFSMSSLSGILLREELDSRPMKDARELYAKFGSVDDENEEEIQKNNLSILLVWLNKDKKHNDLLKCPNCKKILIPNF